MRSTTARACLANISLRSKLRLDWDDRTKTVAQPAAAPFLKREYPRPLEAGSVDSAHSPWRAAFTLASVRALHLTGHCKRRAIFSGDHRVGLVVTHEPLLHGVESQFSFQAV